MPTTGSHLPAPWALRGDPVPAIGRGFLVAVPVTAGLLTELQLDDAVAGGVGTAAMICGFIAFDAPARVRVRWQLCCAPLIGMVAAATGSFPLAISLLSLIYVVGLPFIALAPETAHRPLVR